MSYQQTSIEAYHEIIRNGLLRTSQLRVYEYIYRHQPCTINQMLADLAKPGQNTGSLTGRISDLSRMGAIRVAGKVKASSTGHNVYLWEVTGRLPEKLKKTETKAEAIARLLKRVVELEAEVVRLKSFSGIPA